MKLYKYYCNALFVPNNIQVYIASENSVYHVM